MRLPHTQQMQNSHSHGQFQTRTCLSNLCEFCLLCLRFSDCCLVCLTRVWWWDHAMRRRPIRSLTFKKIWGIWNTRLKGVVRERRQALDWTIICRQARCIASECCWEGCYSYSSHPFFRFFKLILFSRRALPRDKLSVVTRWNSGSSNSQWRTAFIGKPFSAVNQCRLPASKQAGRQTDGLCAWCGNNSNELNGNFCF